MFNSIHQLGEVHGELAMKRIENEQLAFAQASLEGLEIGYRIIIE